MTDLASHRYEGSGAEDEPESFVDQEARRREAALRLPPMRCGCRDPESWVHRESRCRFRAERMSA